MDSVKKKSYVINIAECYAISLNIDEKYRKTSKGGDFLISAMSIVKFKRRSEIIYETCFCRQLAFFSIDIIFRSNII